MALRYLTDNGRTIQATSGGEVDSGLPKSTSSSLTITNNAPSYDTVTGALIVAGGIGIGGNLNAASAKIVGAVSASSAFITNGLTAGSISTRDVDVDNIVTTLVANIGQLFSNSIDVNQANFSNVSVAKTAVLNQAWIVQANIETIGANIADLTDVDAVVVKSDLIKVDHIVPRTNQKVSLGTVNKVSIFGGENRQILTTDGSGNLRWDWALDQIQVGSGLEKINGQLRLTSTGIEPGTYGVVDVDAFGRVVAGNNNLTISDLLAVTQRGATTDQVIVINNTTESDDVNRGALIVSGGVGVGQQLTANTIVTIDSAIIGGDLTVAGSTKFNKPVVLSSAEIGLPPLVLKPGRLVDNPAAGSLEFDGSGLYISTDLGRKQLQIAPEADTTSTVFAVRVVARTNIDLSNPQQNQVVDDVYYDYWDSTSLVSGDRVLLVNQTNPVENGIYVWSGAGVALVRSQDFNAVSRIRSGSMVKVVEGLQNVGCVWSVTTIGYIFADVTPITFTEIIGKDVMALASLVDDTAGIVTRTGRGAIELRTISSDSNFVQVVNDNGVDGNIVIKTGIVPVSSGGTGRSKFFGYLRGVGNAITSGNTIPSTSITGLGTLAKQNANAVVITGGVIAVEDSAVTGRLYANKFIGGNANITNATITNLTLINKPYQVFSFSPSLEWTIRHNRGTHRMQVSLYDSSGEQFYAKVKLIDDNTVKITLTEANSGAAVVYFMDEIIQNIVPVITPFITEDGHPIITETGANIVAG
jgi:hypothetical protein